MNISLEDLLKEAGGGTTDPATVTSTGDPTVANPDTTVVNPEPTNPATPATPPVTPPVTETPNPANPTEPAVKTPDKNPADKNPMKEIRDKLNAEQKLREKIDKSLQRYTEGTYDFKLKDFKTEGNQIDYDSFIKAMDDADLKAKATSKGISPEVQAEIDRINAEKDALEKEKLKVSMTRALTDMQQDLQLNKNDINQFFQDSVKAKKNPYLWLAQGGDLNDLYYIIYKDKLMADHANKAVEEAKLKWSAEANKPTPPIQNPGTPNPAKTPGGADGVSLAQLLADASKRKK